MQRSEKLHIKPALIRWARESAGMSVTEAAKRLGIDSKILEEWESSEARPTPRQLEKLADVYKRPTACFFMPQPPMEPPLPIDFRVLFTGISQNLSAPTLFALRRARRLQRVFADLANGSLQVKLSTIDVTVSLDDSPEAAAEKARTLLNVSTDDQSLLKYPSKAFKVWRHELGRIGILVFQFSMPLNEVRGFSLSGIPAVIVVSTKDEFSARIFTLFHEWAHLLLDRPGICVPDAIVQTKQTDRIEIFCNTFAGSLLVPRNTLLEQEIISAYRTKSISLMEALGKLASVFAVSRDVILRRMYALGLLPKSEFEDARLTLATLASQRKPPAGGGGQIPSEKALNELGPMFVRRVLEAHNRGVITYRDISDFLSIRLKHLEQIQELLPAA